MSSGSQPRSSWQPPSLADLQALLPGYEFHSLLGRGGMGAVFRATQRSLNRSVAIKVLPAKLMEDSEANFAARFRQESLTMAKLTHPGIVSVLESGEAGGLLYIVMEFVDGTDVARMIASEGKLAPELATKLLTQVCEALHYAHEHGVIHRDIKPANLLLTRDGTVKIADFGLAKHDDDALLGLTKTNVAIGTPDFLAPEAWTPNTPLDSRADVYALGVTLYQMLTGEVPRGLWKMPSVKAGVDVRFDAIIDRAMQPDRDARYQSSTELRLDLEKIQAGPDEGGSARAASGVGTESPRSARLATSRRRRMTAALVASVMLLAGGFAWLAWLGPPDHNTLAPPAPAKRLVTTTADSGPGSLRQAIFDSPNGTTITFATKLSGRIILLTGGQLELDRDVTIDASALPGGIHLDGNGQGRVFKVASNAIVVLDSLIITNGLAADSSGGGIASGGDLWLKNCTVVGNQAKSTGGGISATSGRVGIVNSTLTRNTAGKNGGAVAVHGSQGSLTLIHCTISGNQLQGASAGTGGGGVYGYHSMIYCTNSIIAGNTSGTGPGPDLWCRARLIAAAGCLIGDAADSAVSNGVNGNLTGVSALLAPLGDYGGPTPTMPPLPGSPALNGCASGPGFVTDQRGFPRLAGPFADIGAVEFPDTSPVVVNNADSGPGSLRYAVAYWPAGSTITFTNALSGQTIQLTSEIALTKSVTIDASSLTGGLTIRGQANQGAAGNFRLFNVTGAGHLTLRSLTLAQGGGSAIVNGGAIYTESPVTLTGCTLTGNVAGHNGGAIFNHTAAATLSLFHCTFTANTSAAAFGGAIANDSGSVGVSHCTITGNSARAVTDGAGGGIFSSYGTLSITNSIVAGNTSTTGGADIHNGGTLTLAGANIVPSLFEDRPTAPMAGPSPLSAPPLLAPLGHYGGPTPTMPPLPGSPAIDAAIGSVFTNDQRGFPRPIGAAPDIGAAEYRRDK